MHRKQEYLASLGSGNTFQFWKAGLLFKIKLHATGGLRFSTDRKAPLQANHFLGDGTWYCWLCGSEPLQIEALVLEVKLLGNASLCKAQCIHIAGKGCLEIPLNDWQLIGIHRLHKAAPLICNGCKDEQLLCCQRNWKLNGTAENLLQDKRGVMAQIFWQHAEGQAAY